LIMLFGGSPTVLKRQDRYTVVFQYAPGVEPGTPVRRSGVRIGQVQKVELDDVTGKVRVTISIDRPHVLFQDDQPVLVHGALRGDSSIDFVRPKPEEKPTQTESPHARETGTPIKPVSFVLAQAPKDKPSPPDQPPQRVPAKPGTEFTGKTQADV